MELSYFYHVENRRVKAQWITMHQENGVVLDHGNNKRFVIPYY